MKCIDCGNTSVFTHREVSLEKCCYDPDGNITDGDYIEIVESIPVCCYECGSENISAEAEIYTSELDSNGDAGCHVECEQKAGE